MAKENNKKPQFISKKTMLNKSTANEDTIIITPCKSLTASLYHNLCSMKVNHLTVCSNNV